MLSPLKPSHRTQYKQSFTPKKNQKAYDQIQCEAMIKHALDDMKNDGFDFGYATKQQFDRNDRINKIKQMLRTVYLRFNCRKCKNFQNKNKQRRWTSTCGTVGIKFQFEKIKQKRRFPYKIKFRVKIYGMECLGCHQFGQAQVYDSQLQKIQQQFCKIIANILKEVPPKKPRRNSEKQIPQLVNHLCQLCQACSLRKCACKECKNN